MTALSPVTLQSSELDAQLRDLQDRAAKLREGVEREEARREEQARYCDQLVDSCNRISDEAQPILTRERRLVRCQNVASRVGLVTGFGMAPLGICVIAGVPGVGWAAALVAATLGGAALAVEWSKRGQARLDPECDRLIARWNGAKRELDGAREDLSHTRIHLDSLRRQLAATEGPEQVLRVAKGATTVTPPEERVQDSDDAVIIGKLRIPKRVAGR